MIDSHVHLDNEDFDADRDEVIGRARAVGVSACIVPATTPASARALLAADWAAPAGGAASTTMGGSAAGAVGPDIHPAAGIHPHEVAAADESALDEVEALVRDESRVRAVGETGIDYFYGDASSRTKQMKFFEAHLDLAARYSRPVIVHSRDGQTASAFSDVLNLIRSSRAIGVLHSFTGTRAEAEAALELGWYIGLGGILTFRTSQLLRETARHIPDDRLLLETDAPYLAPIPLRGKRNEPSFIIHTLNVLAEIRSAPPSDLALLITSNARRLFQLT